MPSSPFPTSPQSISGAQRMVVGHTIQAQGINSACDGRVYRVDVGLSRGCGDGDPQVLEILRDARVRRLSEGAPPEEISPGPGLAAGSPTRPTGPQAGGSGWDGMRERLRELFGGSAGQAA